MKRLKRFIAGIRIQEKEESNIIFAYRNYF